MYVIRLGVNRPLGRLSEEGSEVRDQFQQMGKREDATELALHLLAQLQGATLLTHAFSDPNLFTRQIADAKSWLQELS